MSQEILLPSEYQSFVHLSRYARWLPSEGRRESWEETVSRLILFFEEHLKKNHDFDLGKTTANRLKKGILNLEVVPSMRALWAAGLAAERDNVACYNCLSGDTLVMTKEYGLCPIESVSGKTVHVIDGNGDWVPAPCKSYGNQSLLEIEFATSGKGKFSVKSTPNHDWIIDGKRVKAEDLSVGQSVDWVLANLDDVDCSNQDYIDGLHHGIIFGDGTTNRSIKKQRKTCDNFFIRICEDHKDFHAILKEFPHSYPPSFGGDPVYYLTGEYAAFDLKSLPPEPCNDSYIKGFVRGWVAADGSVGKSSRVSLACSEHHLNWLYKNGPRVGFVPTSKYKYPNKTNYGERKTELWSVSFDRRYLTKDDFVTSRKKDKFEPIVKKFGFGKITSIKEVESEEVFCFSVKTTQSFMLSRNILTGNCSALPIDKTSSFDELFYILMNGCGVGFSVERQFINKLPEVADTFYKSDTTIVVTDSTIGWCKALKELIGMLYVGQIPKWDLSKIRPAGTPLKTKGGRASGGEILGHLFDFVVATFKFAAGRKLNSLECHDICCKIAEIVTVGGCRRSALLSLSNLSDLRMREAKVGRWFDDNAQRAMANNSVAYTEKPDIGIFMEEWKSLYDSKSGERGIFNRESCKKIVEKIGRRDVDHEFLTNPCVTADTWVDTSDGRIQVKDLINKPFKAVICGKGYDCRTGFFFTGKKKVYKLTTTSGYELKCTFDHKILTMVDDQQVWVQAGDLVEESKICLNNPNVSKIDTTNLESFEYIGYDLVYDCTVDEVHRFGANGIIIHNCSEILLRPRGFCNLSEVVLREYDTEETILEKIELATILGTVQSTFTNFRYLSKTWKKNAEEERLLGVSMTGIMDCPLTNDSEEGLEDRLTKFKEKAIEVNEKWAKKIGINQSAAITCVKPSGNTSQLCDTASGIHTRHSPYYIRTVRSDKKDPLTKLMIDKGFPYEDEVNNPQNIAVFSFPIKAPENSFFRYDKSALEQLELWKKYQLHWCVSGDTKILCEEGYREIRDLVGLKVNVWNGSEWSQVKPFETGKQMIYNVTLSNGIEVKCTEDHKFIMKDNTKKHLKDISIGEELVKFNLPLVENTDIDPDVDAYSQGFYAGDGYSNGDWSCVYAPKYCCINRLSGHVSDTELPSRSAKLWKHGKNMLAKNWVPLNNSVEFKLNWLAGILDSDGCTNGKGLQIASSDKAFLEKLQLMLTTLGCQSIVKVAGGGKYVKMPDGNGGEKEYFQKEFLYLNISGFFTEQLKNIGLKTERVKLNGEVYKDRNHNVKVISITKLHEDETFCFTEEKNNCGVFNGMLLGQCEHKPSITVSVKEDEWLDVGAWVYKNFDLMSGVSFLPFSDHVYQQAPYQDCTKEEYEELLAKMPKDVDWSELSSYESSDMTTGARELACTAGGCEL